MEILYVEYSNLAQSMSGMVELYPSIKNVLLPKITGVFDVDGSALAPAGVFDVDGNAVCDIMHVEPCYTRTPSLHNQKMTLLLNHMLLLSASGRLALL